MSAFTATLLGSAFGVVAGALIQYLVAILVIRYRRTKNLADLRVETEYNLAIAEQMLDEVQKFRAAAQPATFQSYSWWFRAKDMLGIALKRIIDSGELYRMFSKEEILDIQALVQFLNPNMEQFISDRINELKVNDDVNGAHQFANHIEREINARIKTIRALLAKHHEPPPHWYQFWR